MPYKYDFAEVAQKHPIEEVMRRLKIELKEIKPNFQWKGRDPICKRNGFTVTVGKGFYCHGCGEAKGDSIDLVVHIKKLSRKEAAAYLEGDEPEEHRGVKDAGRSVHSAAVNNVLEEIAKRLDPSHEKCQELGVSPDTLRFFGGGFKGGNVGAGNVLAQLHDPKGVLKGYIGIDSPWFHKNIKPEEYVFNVHRLTPGPVKILPSPLHVIQAYHYTDDLNAVAFLSEEVQPLQGKFLMSLLEERNCFWVP